MWLTLSASRFGLIFASILLASNCLADVIYSDLNAPLDLAGTLVIGTTAATEFGPHVAYQNGEQIFQAGEGLALTSVTVGAYYFAAQVGFTASPTDVFSPDFDVWLYSNYVFSYVIHGRIYYQNQPGTALEEVQQGLTAPNNLGLVTATSSLGTTVLDKGSLYWIVLKPDNPDTLVGWGVVDGGPESLEVDGRQITPEPSTFAFVTLAGCVVLLLARKRRIMVVSGLL